jgi:dipeptidyl aminopeptidase/acylaminoacyl peptidase
VTEEDARRGAGDRVLTAAEGPELGAARGRYYLYLRQNGLWTREVTGFDPTAEARQLDPYCPARSVAVDFPPTLLVHGTEDTDVPHDRSVLMSEALRRHGVACELISVRGAGHGLSGGDRDEVSRARQRALETIRKHLDPPPAKE